MTAGRGYIIRFYKEYDGKSYFIETVRTSIKLGSYLSRASVFTEIEDADKMVIDIKKRTKKQHKRGYLYISKVFYKKVNIPSYKSIANREMAVAVKLTKPDRHDFINMI